MLGIACGSLNHKFNMDWKPSILSSLTKDHASEIDNKNSILLSDTAIIT